MQTLQLTFKKKILHRYFTDTNNTQNSKIQHKYGLFIASQLQSLHKIFPRCYLSYFFRWCKRIKTDDCNRLIKTNMAVHYHTSAVIQIQCPGRVQACKYTYLNKVPFKKANLNVTSPFFLAKLQIIKIQLKILPNFFFVNNLFPSSPQFKKLNSFIFFFIHVYC